MWWYNRKYSILETNSVTLNHIKRQTDNRHYRYSLISDKRVARFVIFIERLQYLWLTVTITWQSLNRSHYPNAYIINEFYNVIAKYNQDTRQDVPANARAIINKQTNPSTRIMKRSKTRSERAETTREAVSVYRCYFSFFLSLIIISIVTAKWIFQLLSRKLQQRIFENFIALYSHTSVSINIIKHPVYLNSHTKCLKIILRRELVSLNSIINFAVSSLRFSLLLTATHHIVLSAITIRLRDNGKGDATE